MTTDEVMLAGRVRELVSVLNKSGFDYNNPRPNISRVDNPYSSTHGWSVRIQRNGVRFSAFFSDGAMTEYDIWRIRRDLSNQLNVMFRDIPAVAYNAAWTEEVEKRKIAAYLEASKYLDNLLSRLPKKHTPYPYHTKGRSETGVAGVSPIKREKTVEVPVRVGDVYSASSTASWATVTRTSSGEEIVWRLVAREEKKAFKIVKQEVVVGYTASWQDNGKQRRKRFYAKDYDDSIHRAYAEARVFRAKREKELYDQWNRKNTTP